MKNFINLRDKCSVHFYSLNLVILRSYIQSQWQPKRNETKAIVKPNLNINVHFAKSLGFLFSSYSNIWLHHTHTSQTYKIHTNLVELFSHKFYGILSQMSLIFELNRNVYVFFVSGQWQKCMFIMITCHWKLFQTAEILLFHSLLD